MNRKFKEIIHRELIHSEESFIRNKNIKKI